jgi:sigma-B regulation protein RsbU (phosphoserine phosphatase)
VATNLWTDVEALARLADITRTVESPSAMGGDVAGDAALPESLESPFVEIGSAELPARVVSGDFHAAFRLSEDTLALAIGDISGKGVPAGVLRAFTASMVRSVSSFSASPEDVLSRVNAMICGARLEALYATIFLGWLDLPTGRLRYANAGHPRPFRIAQERSVRPLGEVTGPILGILDDVSFGAGEEWLESGETVVLYTDGVTEARNAAGRFIGPRGLSLLLARHARKSAGSLCAALADAIDARAGGARHDDATLLAAHFHGGAQVVEP